MTRKHLSARMLSGVIVTLATVAALLPAWAGAQTMGITFPVPELGNCISKDECRAYCDAVEHAKACLDFGTSHGLVAKDDAAQAKTLLGATGPGGCKGAECKAYCDDAAHHDECYAFAKTHGLIAKEKTDAFDKEKASLQKNKGGPGGCLTHEACADYCNDQSHLDECLQFGTQAGLIAKNEAVNIKKLSGQGPGGCRGESCKTYCDMESHTDECLTFAQDNGLISKDDADKAKQLLMATGPGECKGAECKTYCADEAHHDECFIFAKEHNLITKQETDKAAQSQQLIKMIQTSGGPGGCRTKADCRDYCSDAAHSGACLNFTIQNTSANKEQIQKRYDELKNKNTPPKLNGPGGCDTPQSCYEYCIKSETPSACARTFRKATSGGAGADIKPVPLVAPVNTCAGDACQNLPVQELPRGSGTAPTVPSAQSGNESNHGTPPPPSAGSKNDLIKYIQDNCAKYGGVWNGTVCQPPAKPVPHSDGMPVGQDSPPTSGYHTQSFLGSIIDFLLHTPRR